MVTPGRIEVDLTAIERNVTVLRDLLTPPSSTTPDGPTAPPGICAVLKSDGYALGAARIAKRLSILNIEMVAVYTADQARNLVEAAITTPILILMPVRDFDRSDALYRAAWHGRLHLTIHDQQNLEAVADIADRLGVAIPVHLALDTGMSRGGAPLNTADALLQGIEKRRRLSLVGVCTHFASADGNPERTETQAALFDEWLERHHTRLPGDCIIHCANTFATFRSRAYHRSMVRIGLALYGYAAEEFADPENFEFIEHARKLTPAVRWLNQIVQIKAIERGMPVGYGSTWTAQRRTIVGIVPTGYADGYPLALANKGHMGVELRDGSRVYVPVIGRVSMDQTAVDLTDLPPGEAELGAPIELIGANPKAPNHLPTMAKLSGTITHELLCRLSPRVPRTYLALDAARQSDRDTMRYIDAGAPR